MTAVTVAELPPGRWECVAVNRRAGTSDLKNELGQTRTVKGCSTKGFVYDPSDITERAGVFEAHISTDELDESACVVQLVQGLLDDGRKMLGFNGKYEVAFTIRPVKEQVSVDQLRARLVRGGVA